MQGNKEMSNKYIEFLAENFPNLPLKRKKTLEKIHKKVCENNIMSDFFLINVHENYPHAKLEYIKIYKLQLNKILIYIGINDQDAISFCFRCFIEDILKFVYSLQNDYELDKINKTNFRFLSESLKDDTKQLYTGMKDDISKLLSYYGQYSNGVHGKNIDIDNEVEYMKLIISNEDNVDYNKLYRDLNNIVKLYELILIKSLKLKLDSTVVFRLEKIMTNDEIKEIFNVI